MRLRIERPEIQRVAFDGAGAAALAEREDGRLHLRLLAPGEGADPERAGRRVLLDEAFPGDFDFVQDVRPASGGRWIVTRGSGWVHLVGADGAVETLQLARLDPEGLYYTAVLRDGRVCATYCADLTVVCQDAPEPVGALR